MHRHQTQSTLLHFVLVGEGQSFRFSAAGNLRNTRCCGFLPPRSFSVARTSLKHPGVQPCTTRRLSCTLRLLQRGYRKHCVSMPCRPLLPYITNARYISFPAHIHTVSGAVLYPCMSRTLLVRFRITKRDLAPTSCVLPSSRPRLPMRLAKLHAVPLEPSSAFFVSVLKQSSPITV